MIHRSIGTYVEESLRHFPVVGLLGARQIGKTTLAHEVAGHCPSIYLDLENYQDLAKLQDPLPYLEQHKDKLIILDEVQRQPEIFMSLRSLVDHNRRAGHRYGQFLILGSASSDLLRQSSESLAGRILYIDMHPLSIIELPSTPDVMKHLWLRGGFPDSFLAPSNALSMGWRQAFITTYLERDIPQLGPRIAAGTLRRLWTMLAHSQGSPLNSSLLGSSLGLSGQTISRYIDILSDVFLIRRLEPWHANVRKRLVKTPKIYVRDSGIVHALLQITTMEHLHSHPIMGASWEGFVIDNILSVLPPGVLPYFYRTSRGAEIDLLLVCPDGRCIAIEIKHASVPKLQRGFFEACEDIQPSHRYVVYTGSETYLINSTTTAISLKNFMEKMATWS